MAFQLPNELPQKGKPNYTISREELAKDRARITLSSFGLPLLKKVLYQKPDVPEKDQV